MSKIIRHEINGLLDNSRNEYRSLYDEYSEVVEFNFADAYLHFFKFSALNSLLKKYLTNKKKKLISKEIEVNFTANNDYFESFNLLLDRQFEFISKFTDALKIYSNNKELALKLFNEVQLAESEINKNDFFLGLQIYYIEVYVLLEDVYTDYYPLNKKRLFGEFNTRNLITKTILKFNIKNLYDEDIKKLNVLLLAQGYIKTEYKEFKRVLTGSPKNGDLILWSDIADNKEVNKQTLLELVECLINDKVEIQNKFIVNYFHIITPKNSSPITLDMLKNARKIFRNKIEKPSKQIIIKDFFKDIKT